MHVDEWAIGVQPNTDGERAAMAWVREFRKPAHMCDHDMIERTRVTAKYHGRRYRVVMASRMGDVGLSRNMDEPNGYSKRVDVLDLSDWSMERPEPTDD